MRFLCILVLFGFLGSVRGYDIISHAQIAEAAKTAARNGLSILNNAKFPFLPTGLTSRLTKITSSKIDGVSSKQDQNNPTELTLRFDLNIQLTFDGNPLNIAISTSINFKPEAVNGAIKLDLPQNESTSSTKIVTLDNSLSAQKSTILNLLTKSLQAEVKGLLRTAIDQLQLELSLKRSDFHSVGGLASYFLNGVQTTPEGLVYTLSISPNGQAPIPFSTAANPCLQPEETRATYVSAKALGAMLSQLKTSSNRKLTAQESTLFGDQTDLTLRTDLKAPVTVTIDTAPRLAIWADLSILSSDGPLIRISFGIKVGADAVTEGDNIGLQFDPNTATFEPGEVTQSTRCNCPDVTVDPLSHFAADLRHFLELFSYQSKNLVPRPNSPPGSGPVTNKDCTYEPDNLRCGQTLPSTAFFG